jgi:hypothetical protein
LAGFDLTAEGRDYFVEMGRVGGKKGVSCADGKVDTRTRRKIAQQAIAARWAKRGEKLY